MATSKTASCFQGGVRFQDGSLQATAAFGTVTSVAMTGDGVIFNASITGSPITVSGTLIPVLLTQTAKFVLIGPTSGGAATPTFRALVAGDIPSLAYVTSVSLTAPAEITVGGSPITSSGTLALTWTNESANKIFAGPTSGGATTPTFRSLVTADMPVGTGTVTSVALTAPAEITVGGSPITASGTLALTWANESANTVFAGPTSGGAATPGFRALVAADISGLVSAAWSSLTAAAADLTLANGAFITTFNQTSAAIWTWANTTAATSGGVTASSPIIKLGARLFSSGVDTSSLWSVQAIPSPTTALTFTTTNLVETAGSVVTATIGTHTLVVGNMITISGITGTYSFLNLQNARISAVAATTISFTDPTSHGTQGSAASNGTVTQIPVSQLSLSMSGGAGDQQVLVPTGASGGSTGANYGGLAFPLGGSFGEVSTNGYVLKTSLANTGNIRLYTGGSVSGALAATITFNSNSTPNGLTLQSSVTNGAILSLGNITTLASGVCVLLGNTGTITATSGTNIGIRMGGTASVGGTLNFAPTSGTATFTGALLEFTVNQTSTASGAYTGFKVNVIETALLGTGNLLLDLQAGTTGGTSKFAINNSGVCTKYAGIATVSQGMPAEYATVDLTAQSAAIGATTIYAVPAGGSGMYRVSWSATITTAATTSSVLGGAGGFQAVYTSSTDSVVKTTVTDANMTSAANTTATAVGGTMVVYAKASTNIQYSFGYTSVGVTAMVYELHIKVEAM